MTFALWWVWLVGSVMFGGYGMLNVLAPSMTTRWQMRSTAKASEGDPRRTVGTALAGWLGISASFDPQHDPAVLRRVRWIGLAELVTAAAIASVLWSVAR